MTRVQFYDNPVTLIGIFVKARQMARRNIKPRQGTSLEQLGNKKDRILSQT